MAPGIRDEIKQDKPFPNPEDEVLVGLVRTADAVMRRVAEALKKEGLSPTQYNVLRILRGAGPGGLACREVAERMITRDPDLTRLLDRLEKRGLTVRNREAKDRRVVVTRITREGLKVLEALDEPAAECGKRAFGHLSPAELETLGALLQKVRSAP